jgi:hypothetical protein
MLGMLGMLGMLEEACLKIGRIFFQLISTLLCEVKTVKTAEKLFL